MYSGAKKRRRQGRRDFGSIKADSSPADGRLSVTWWEGGRQRRKRGFTGRTDAAAFLAGKRVELDKAPPEHAPVAPLDVTMKTAITAYESHRREKGNKADALAATSTRLRTFFTEEMLPLVSLTPAKCSAYYESLRTRRQPRTVAACERAATARAREAERVATAAGTAPPKAIDWSGHELGAPGCKCKPYATDTHRNTLAEARSLLKWCMTVKRWLRRSPLDGIEGKGKRRHGKPQLRIDEARLWMAKATELAEAGETGAVAAMMALLLGMRATEIVTRVVRDLDDEGRLLWIPETKTEAGRRTLRIPDVLRPHLQALAEGKPREARLFGQHWRDWPREWVERICAAAGVPKVSAHSMRGLHSTLAMEAGVTGAVVAASLGHENVSTTTQSYAKPEAVAIARQRRALTVLVGGRSA